MSDEIINNVWNHWVTSSTLTNAFTSRPASYPAKNDPLLKGIDTSNFILHTTKRDTGQYQHQFHVQNGTNKDIFNLFREQNPDLTFGFTTFCKVKPFFVRVCQPRDIETCCCLCKTCIF